jgi:nicotinate-nucleotide adenylyltransferase
VKRIGILGGTFNPVHIGHLAIAETACDKLKLDKVLFIPSYYPPHKSRAHVIAAKYRYSMVKLAIKGNPRFEAVDFEVKRPGRSYSINTLEYLRRLYPPRTKFFFIIGSDMIDGLKEWKRVNDLVKIVQFIVITRKGYENKKEQYNARIINTLDLGISSSYLRQALSKGIAIRYLIPDKVLGYIRANRLYNS